MKSLVVLLLIASCLAMGKACSCEPKNDTVKYCDSNNDFVALVKVKDGGTSTKRDGHEKVRYKVDVLETYYVRPNYELEQRYVKTHLLFTAKGESLCGVTLTEGKFYVLAGTFAGGECKADDRGNGCKRPRMETYLCNLRIQYNARSDVDFVTPTC